MPVSEGAAIILKVLTFVEKLLKLIVGGSNDMAEEVVVGVMLRVLAGFSRTTSYLAIVPDSMTELPYTRNVNSRLVKTMQSWLLSMVDTITLLNLTL